VPRCLAKSPTREPLTNSTMGGHLSQKHAQFVSESERLTWNGYHFTSGDVARLLEVDLKTVHNWVSRGHVDGRRTEGRHLRFSRSEVVRFMRRFGYPVPTVVGEAPPRIVIDTTHSRASALRRSLSRSCVVTPCDGLFACSLAVATGAHEAVIVDLDVHPRHQLAAFNKAVRSWASSKQVCLLGIGSSNAALSHFVRNGGDAALSPERERDVAGVVRWLVGVDSNCPRGVEALAEQHQLAG